MLKPISLNFNMESSTKLRKKTFGLIFFHIYKIHVKCINWTVQKSTRWVTRYILVLFTLENIKRPYNLKIHTHKININKLTHTHKYIEINATTIYHNIILLRFYEFLKKKKKGIFQIIFQINFKTYFFFFLVYEC